jgi:phosphomannomutase/phosphoglucomutase
VTASHNDNGWTGIKMGIERPLTFAPDDMTALKERVLQGGLAPKGGGSYIFVPDIPERYMADLLKRPKLMRPLRAVVSCGNGTAGAFAPRVLAELGVTVAANCELTQLPRAQPNRGPAMLNATRWCRQAPISVLPSTATATVAAWSTTRARRSSPTRSA